MATTMRLLPVRTTAAVRAIIDQAGPVNAATRVDIIGAHSAGLSVTGLEQELALLLAGDLEQGVAAALQHVYHRLIISASEKEAQHLLAVERPSDITETRPAGLAGADLFGTIGIEV